MQRALLLCLALGLVVAEGYGQSIQGRITDAETQEPLVGATIFIPSLQLGTATDQDGRFDVNPGGAGTYRLVFSYVGYQSESRTVTLEETPVTLDVALQHTTLESPAITITAKAQASDILSTPQAVTVLEGRDLVLHRGITAFDALGKTSGVRLLRTGPGIAKPMVRGLTSQRVLVIQNGIRQEGQQWGDEHAPELDAFDIDRIEVVKGPASLLYGSDALGGVIQAASGDLFEKTRPLSGQVALQGLSNTRQGAGHIQLGGHTGNVYYGGALSAKRGGSYENPEGVVPNTGLEELNGSARLGYSLGRTKLQAEYQHFNAKIGLFEPEEDHEEEEHHEDEEGIEEASLGRFEIGQPFQRVQHNRAKMQAELPVAGNRLELVATWQQNQRKEFEEHGHGAERALSKRAGLLSEEEEAALYLRLNTVTTDARFHHRPVGRLFGTIGVSGFFQDNETLGEESLIPGGRTANGGIYVFEEYVLPRLTLSGGLRFDARKLDVDDNTDLEVTAQTRNYTAVTGAFGLAWQPTTGVSVAVNTGRAWRAPVLIELFGNGVHEGTIRFERGNAALVPEASLTFESTLRWLTSHAYLEVSGFVNHIDNFIFPRRSEEIDPESGFYVYNYTQAEARLWGGEVRADLHPHNFEWLQLHLVGDVTLTRNLDTDTPLPFSPPSRLLAEVELEKKQWGTGQNIGLRFGPTFVAEQTQIDPSEEATPGYTLWNASVSGTWQASGLTVTPILAVDNLFDEAYLSHLSRYRPYGVLNPGRNIRFEVVFTF